MYNFFDQCTHCGECCTIPGMFLPEQIDVLAAHLAITRKALFTHYLIAHLWAPTDNYASPDDCVAPVFILSPVRATEEGKRLPQKIFDINYGKATQLHCIFRDRLHNRCGIYQNRPFECALTLCSKMTKDKPLYIGKNYYYHKWKNAQEIPLSMFPQIRPAYEKLQRSVEGMRNSFQFRNIVMNGEIASFLNGYPHEVPICL
jgi:hypothetical protein